MNGRPPSNGAEPLSRDDLRRAEARMDNQADRRSDAFRARVESELAAVDRRFDGLGTRLDIHDIWSAAVRDELAVATRRSRAALWRTTVLGLVATVVVTGLLVGGTVWVVR